MRALFSALVLTLLLVSPARAQVAPTWIVLGDSIQSNVADGVPAQLDWHLIQAERNISIRNLSTPGAMMGLSNAFGFNSDWTTTSLDHICGFFNACTGVIIQAGSNDFGAASVSWTNVSDSMLRVITWARAKQKKVFVLDLIWRSEFENAPANHMNMTFAEYRIARSLVCTWNSDVCTFAVRPAPFNVATPFLFAAAEQPNTLVHPNAAGHRVMASWIESAAASAGLF